MMIMKEMIFSTKAILLSFADQFVSKQMSLQASDWS